VGALARLVVSVVFVCAGTQARADEPRDRDRDRAEADELFQKGKGALGRQDYPRACQYFQDSQRLDPAIGTLLNLALCQEIVGKFASAWNAFKAVEDEAGAQKPPQFDRVRIAREHADALYPRLSRLRIQVLPSVRVPGLTVSIDGRPIAESFFDLGVPVDGGPHEVVAVAPGRVPYRTRVTTEKEHDVKVIQILPLAVAFVDERKSGSVDIAHVENLAAARTQRTVGVVVMGIGGAAIITGGVFGTLAILQSSTAAQCAPCVSPDPASDARLIEARDAYNRGIAFANIANVMIPIGAVATIVGGLLFFTAKTPIRTGPASSLYIAPTWNGQVTAGGKF
jgi:hypothetical protein